MKFARIALVLLGFAYLLLLSSSIKLGSTMDTTATGLVLIFEGGFLAAVAVVICLMISWNR